MVSMETFPEGRSRGQDSTPGLECDFGYWLRRVSNRVSVDSPGRWRKKHTSVAEWVVHLPDLSTARDRPGGNRRKPGLDPRRRLQNRRQTGSKELDRALGQPGG